VITLDTDFVRAQFPAFSHPDAARWAHLENAGGSYVPHQVIDVLTTFFTATKVQPYWDFAPSARAGEAMDLAKARMPATFNAEPTEVHFGPSTTQNTYVLAQALRAGMLADAEVIVTNQDHEANIGAWRRLADTGVTVHEWAVDATTGMLHLADLDALLNERAALVAMTHASNIAATINPVAGVAERVHSVGGLLCVDGVSYAPHARIDVAELECDIYLYSAYKTYGPHVGMMYVAAEAADTMANQGHFFNAGTATGRLVPAGPNHAEIAACGGVMAYYDAVHAHHFGSGADDDVAMLGDVFDLFGTHEAALMKPMAEFLTTRDGVHLVGSQSGEHADRAPTFAFWSERSRSADIYQALIDADVSCGHGHFYAIRLVQALGLDPDDGLVRLSMVHYNTPAEVDRALEVLDRVL
jgi:cysteine desulfurase family protein (TIGR01976 family)